MEKNPTTGSVELELVGAGGLPWIDLANSEALAAQGFEDALADDAALDRWLARIDQGGPPVRFSPDEYAAAREFRSLLVEAAERIGRGEPVGREAVARADAILRRGRIYETLGPKFGGGFEAALVRPRETMDDLLGLFAASFAETLAHGDLSRVRHCEGQGCAMHFHDDSKGGRRRWCSMGVCGNRAKAAAHYRRKAGA